MIDAAVLPCHHHPAGDLGVCPFITDQNDPAGRQLRPKLLRCCKPVLEGTSGCLGGLHQDDVGMQGQCILHSIGKL